MEKRKIPAKVKHEYLTTDISLRKLSKKHGIAMGTLVDASKHDGWYKAKQDHCKAIAERALQRAEDKQVDELESLRRSTTSASALVEQLFTDPLQFFKHVGMGTETVEGGIISSHLEEKTFTKADTKAIRDVTAALKDLAATMRNLYDLPSYAERENMRIAAAKLLIDQHKTGDDVSDAETGVVILPAVMEQPPEETK